jgi:HK97 family phage major capsid protein
MQKNGPLDERLFLCPQYGDYRMSDLAQIHKQLDGIDEVLKAFTEKSDAEIKGIGKLSTETKNALDALGTKQHELAAEIMFLKQRGTAPAAETHVETLGQQFVKSSGYVAFNSGSTNKTRFEYKNTLTGSDTTVAPDRKPGIVGGVEQPLTLEAFLPRVPTTSGAIEYTKETGFTNNAAETAEGAQKPESVLTWSLVNQPIATVAHLIKISRQLAADAPALSAFVDERMRYGVDRRVETQLVSGDGVAPNIAGFMKSGNFTAHGIADAALGTVLKKLVLIRTIMGNLENIGYTPDAIILNPSDWASIDIALFTTAAGQTMRSVNEAGQPVLFGVRVIPSVGMTADTVAVGAFRQACTIYDREQLTVDMSESDGDNFAKNLITIRAERRLALAVERPGAIQAGDLTPA